MSAAPPPAVEIVRARHLYGSAVALDEVSLEVPAGGMFGFIGPDSVGKSTLLALVAGARKPQAGRINVLGGDMRDARHRAAVCPRIAYMPQGLGKNLYATLSVAENLDFFGSLFGHRTVERRRRVGELLEATGLLPFRDRAAGKLSGGMKQKLGLCCALIHDPDLLILDEPTTGVDPLARRQFWELLARIRARTPGMSVLVATAYFDEAERFDRLVAMDAGCIIAADTPAGLRRRTGTRDLEAAFVALLPQARRAEHRAYSAPPRPPVEGEIAIEARDLSCRFGDFVAVDRVSFRIRRGEIFGFLGSNGCGKTTTMKMLTGLLPASDGDARLFGRPVEVADLNTRRRVGFMSQMFSLYTELTVLQNLTLHAHLFHLPRERAKARIDALVAQFELGSHLDDTTDNLPLGVRQRLSLAVAVIHEPEILILDEPTSGVDPIARDRFWDLLVDLSRNRGVTIFISTHFMNEASRCDRISLMHAGRVLAQGTPAEIAATVPDGNLEEAFIAQLRAAATEESAGAVPDVAPRAAGGPPRLPGRFSFARLWAYARRETLELRRDWIRLAFAVGGPLFLMVVFGYGISFDVENLPYAVLDYDRSPDSRMYLENFSSSRYFRERAPLRGPTDLEARLRTGQIKFAIEVPPGFGRDLRAGRRPEVAVWLDGAQPFRAETSRGYIDGVHNLFLAEVARRGNAASPRFAVTLEIRFRYNQEFRSADAIVPGIVMMLLALIPAVMTALGVVREKELGSIVNLYVTPTTGLEFLLGKQLPYIGLALINFATLVALALLLFGIPVKGSVTALIFGAALYVSAITAFGLLISSFVKTQIAAIFATAILTTMPAIQFSGMLMPVSSLSPDARIIGHLFPSTYFQHISVGTFTKALGFNDVVPDFAALALVAAAALALARAALRTQEP